MGLYNSATDILRECAKIESANIVRESVANSQVEDFYSKLLNLEEIEEGYLDYDAEKVGVHVYTSGRYLIEFDDLSKYMLTNKLTAKDAISKICEHYDINEADTHVVIESMDNIMNQLAEAKVCTESGNSLIKNYGKDKMELTYVQFNEMVQSGVKLMTKPGSNNTVKIY